MTPLLVLYATREGQSRRVAEYAAARLRAKGIASELIDARELRDDFELRGHRGAILVASIHGGCHEWEMSAFVRRHRAALEAMPTGFLSVSLSEAAAEDIRASDDDRARSGNNVHRMMTDFFRDTGWTPRRFMPVAGALAYSKYNAVVRCVMPRITRRIGANVDTSHDHEYTDWPMVDRFIDEMTALLPPETQTFDFAANAVAR